ncbi:MAG: hypothetical protein LAN84_06540 [Acidobacteriia bacterium]|nr:hypothetical protein [Terriglobia bacterium]
MRVKISGENDCAKAARGLLRQAGFAVTEFLPGEAVLQGPLAGYAITIEEIAGTERIHLDSVDGPLEAAILKHITQLSKLPVVVDRPGGVVHNDREIVLLAPGSAEQQQAVEFGVLRGLLELSGQQKAAEKALPPRAPWYKRLLP